MILKLIKLSCILLFVSTGVYGQKNKDIQLEYILNQFSEALIKGDANMINTLLSDDFVYLNQTGVFAKQEVESTYKSFPKVSKIKYGKIQPNQDYTIVNAMAYLANGSKKKFGLIVDKYYIIERVGLFEQFLGLPDPVLNIISKAKLICSIPIKKVNDIIIISFKINGSKDFLNFMFDSGAGITALDSAKATLLGIKAKPGAKGLMSASGNDATLKSFAEARIRFGALDLKIKDGVLSNLDNFTKAAGVPIDGIIGYDLLKDHLVELNLDQMVFNIYQGSRIKVKNCEVLPITIDRNGAMVSLTLKTLNQEFKGKFLYDSGSGSSISLNAYGEFKTKISKEISNVGKIGSLDFLNHYSELMTGTITTVEIGNLSFNEIDIEVDNDNLAQWSPMNGLIGIKFIEKFNTWFDYPQEQILIVPRK